MSKIFLSIFNLSITAGWLILAVIALRFLLRRAPRWIVCLLWALVAFRLICPLSPRSAFSLVPSAQTVSPQIMYDTAPSIHSGIPLLDNKVNHSMASSLSPVPADSANPLQIWLPICTAVWLAGFLFLLSHAAAGYLRLRKRVAVSLPLKNNIYLCDSIASPFILGFVHPGIYLPSDIPQQDMDCVITHEASHLARHDHWWKPLGYLLLSVYWFHPLVWAAYLLLCRDIELACDEKAIREMSLEDKKAYAGALLAFSSSRRTIASCPLAFGEVAVKKRVRSVLKYKKPAFWLVVAAVLSCIAAAVCFLTVPENKPGTSGTPDTGNPFGTSYAPDPENIPVSGNTSLTATPAPSPTANPMPADPFANVTAGELSSVTASYTELPEEGERFFVIDGIPQEDIFLYGSYENPAADIMLRAGNRLYRLPLLSGNVGYYLPAIFHADFDHDGSTEYAIRDTVARGTGISVNTVYLLKPEAEAHSLYAAPLNAFTDEITARISAVAEEADECIRFFLDQEYIFTMPAKELFQGGIHKYRALNFTDQIDFQITGDRIQMELIIGTLLDDLNWPWYDNAAHLTATVQFHKDGSFTLTDLCFTGYNQGNRMYFLEN